MRSLWLTLILVALIAGVVGCRSRPAANRTPDSDQTSSAQTGLSAPPASPSTSPAAPDNTLPLIVCFGDSLTAGFGTDPGESYPDFLQRDLDAAGYSYRVVNQGISGNTTKDGLARVDHIISLHPALVVVEFGGNDGLRGLRIEDTRSNLDGILARLRAGKVPFALAGITLPPDYGPDYIHEFQTTYSLLARKYSVPLLPFLLQGVFGVDGMMQADRTHATARGNQVVAGNVLHLMTPLLTRSPRKTP